MEHYRIRRISFLAILFIAVFSSCLKDDFNEISDGDPNPNTDYGGFDYTTISQFEVGIEILNSMSQPIDGVYVELFTANPLDASGQKDPLNSSKVFNGVTDEDGKIDCILSPSASEDSLYLLVNYVGIAGLYEAELSQDPVEFLIGGNIEESTTADYKSTASVFQTNGITEDPTIVNGFYTLGTWTSQGVPDNLEPDVDEITDDFLEDVNATLPEYQELPVSHPQYFDNEDDANLVINESCNVWVTFVHEGAGWTNSLGYYTYETGNPPASADDIVDPVVAFPNVSFRGSGGQLLSGYKVQLQYLDPDTNQYTDVFPAGITIGWLLNARGWTNSTKTISGGSYTVYSNEQLNPEPDEDLKKHTVMLYDEERNLFLLGIEDQRRDNGSDNDFNDAVFYTTVSSATAVDVTLYQPTDTPGDEDGDGITDVFDQYPGDPDKAFNNYYPSEGVFGSLVFEDLWPYRGDYDFNDLVLDYNFNQITNHENEVVNIESQVVVRAIGASYHNAFGVSFNTTPDNIASVSGQRNSLDYLDISSNGTEEGQSKAVVIFFDDAYNALPYPGSGIGVNTVPGNPYSEPDTMLVNVSLSSPMSFSSLGTAPFDPFMIINRIREKEVHLPNYPPTDLADETLLGTGHDRSSIGDSKYYMSDQNLPWAINLPVSFDYPSEKNGISEAHLMFNTWAESYGYNYMDWYQDKTAYRNTSLIYSKTK